MRVDIWSDVVCPWCYIGKRRFEEALAGFEHRDQVEITWHSFELDPEAAPSREGEYVTHLAAKHGKSVPEAQAMLDSMTTTAATVGLTFDFGIARPGNTLDAHRLIHLAGERGVQGAVKERLLRATFTEGKPISDAATLTELAVEAGLDREEVTQVLAAGTYTTKVRADERLAQAYGITGVPFFVIDERYGVSGAQSPEVLGGALEQAWGERSPLVVVGGAEAGEAEGCEDGSCSV